MMFSKNYSFLFILSIWLCFSISCNDKKLPILGIRQVLNGDTLYTQIPDFSLSDHNGDTISKNLLKGQIHVANFFFTSCPTICPKTMRSMVRLADHFRDQKSIKFICFSIDYRKDSVGRLRSYYEKLTYQGSNFHLLHIPTKEEIKRISENYMSIALEDPSAPGGFDHSGWLLLVDKNSFIRSYCLGTDDKDVTRFIDDIDLLLHEN